ncbi:PspC domain-containing protein [Streptomyces sp. NPDC002104]
MSALARPRDGRWIGGVCAGLARRFGISANTMRIIFVVSCLLPGPQFLLYLALWVLLPNEKPSASSAAATGW